MFKVGFIHSGFGFSHSEVVTNMMLEMFSTIFTISQLIIVTQMVMHEGEMGTFPCVQQNV